MKFRYDVDEKPAFVENVTTGIMWAAISLSFVLIIGMIISGMHTESPGEAVFYLQKLLFITGIALVIQVTAGHRLPVVFGPAAVLLVGTVSSAGYSPDSVYTAIVISAVIGSLVAAAGLLQYVGRMFTTRVITVVLMLIAFTLIPTILDLIIGNCSDGTVFLKLIFAFSAMMLIIYANRVLEGLWKATILLWIIVIGTAVYFIVFPLDFTSFLESGLSAPAYVPEISSLVIHPEFEPGVIISFLICYLALIVNDIGSIQGIGDITESEGMRERYKRGVFLTGIINAVSGFFGVVGGVNYSTSAGMILDTKNASRYTLIPAGIILVILAVIPGAVPLMAAIPTLIIGCLLLFVMSSQFSAALYVFFRDLRGKPFDFDNGIIIGFPIILGNLISFLPSGAADALPLLIRPVVANGFVAGVVSVLILEHIIFRRKA